MKRRIKDLPNTHRLVKQIRQFSAPEGHREQFYRRGGKVYYAQAGMPIPNDPTTELIDGYPEELIDIIRALVKGEITPQQALEIIVSAGVPEQRAQEIVGQIVATIQSDLQNEVVPPVPQEYGIPPAPPTDDSSFRPLMKNTPKAKGGNVATPNALRMKRPGGE